MSIDATATTAETTSTENETASTAAEFRRADTPIEDRASLYDFSDDDDEGNAEELIERVGALAASTRQTKSGDDKQPGEAKADKQAKGEAKADPAKAEGKPTGKDGEQKAEPDWSQALLRSRELGISDEQAKDFGTPELLQKALGLLERRGKKGDEQASQPQQAAESATKPEGEQQEQHGSKYDFKLKRAKDQGDWEDSLVDALEGHRDHVDGRLGKIESLLGELVGDLQLRADQQFVKDFESQISALGDDWAEVFGKGEGRALDAEGATMKNRQKLVEKMDALAAGYHARGKKIPSEAELFKEALRAQFGDHFETIARQAVRREAESLQGRMLHRPSSAKAEPVKGDSAAANAVRDYLRDHGLDDDQE